MASSIIIAGNTYPDVPSILIPKVGGGYATYTEGGGGGGATNFFTGTFKGTSTASNLTITIPYTGSGYPVECTIVVEGGMYNSSVTDWYSTIQRYTIGMWNMTKSNATSTPSSSSSGSENYGVTNYVYKSSTSSGTTYSRSGGQTTNTYSSSSATSSGQTVARFRENTKLSVYIAGTSYGFMANVTYRYYVVYSS